MPQPLPGVNTASEPSAPEYFIMSVMEIDNSGEFRIKGQIINQGLMLWLV